MGDDPWPLNEACACGHVEDEHEDSWVSPCAIDGCPCLAFDAVWETVTNIDPDDPNP